MEFSAAETRVDIIRQVFDSTYPVWGEGLSREAYGAWNRAQAETPWGRRHLRRSVLLDAGRPVSSAKWYDLRSRVADRELRTLGIGAVHTTEALRKRGFAAALVERMIEQAGQEGYELALLFSEIGPEFYEKFGFRAIPRFVETVEVKPFVRGAPATLVRSGDAKDLPAVAALSERAAEGASFALIRSAEFAAFTLARKRLLAGLGPIGLRQVEFLVTEEAYDAPAYVILSHGPGGSVLEAWGDRDPSGARLGAMLQTLVARESSQPRLRVRASLPVGLRPPQLQVSDAEDAAEVMMLRTIGSTDLDIDLIDPARVVYQPIDVF